MTEVNLLGTIILRTLVRDQPATSRSAYLLEWDTDAMRFPDNKRANACVNPPYREGWSMAEC